SANNSIGAILNPVKSNSVLIDKSKYGTSWFSTEKPKARPKIYNVSSSTELINKLKEVNSGDIISLNKGTFKLNSSLVIDKEISIVSKNENNRSELYFTSEKTAFEMHPKGNLILKDVILNGNK